MLGDFMRTCREAAVRQDGTKWTKSALADAAGVSRQAMGNWESGARNPRPINLDRWAEALGLSRAQLAKARDLLVEAQIADEAAA